MDRYRVYFTGVGILDAAIESLKAVSGLVEVRTGMALPRPQAQTIPITLVEFEMDQEFYLPPKWVLRRYGLEHYDELDQFRKFPAESHIIYTTFYPYGSVSGMCLQAIKSMPETSGVYNATYPQKSRDIMSTKADGLVAIVNTDDFEGLRRKTQEGELSKFGVSIHKETPVYVKDNRQFVSV